MLVEKAFQDISDDYKKVGREWITLPQTIAASDPLTKDAIEQDGRLSRLQKVKDPLTPFG